LEQHLVVVVVVVLDDETKSRRRRPSVVVVVVSQRRGQFRPSDSNKVLKLLREEKSRDFTILLSRPGGPDGTSHHRGNVTIQTDFHGPKRTRGEISDDIAKVR
jgi:hypothetical protein